MNNPKYVWIDGKPYASMEEIVDRMVDFAAPCEPRDLCHMDCDDVADVFQRFLWNGLQDETFEMQFYFEYRKKRFGI